jgi:hypothetical protein
MSSMSSADAAIGCWDDKAHYSFWRPITAIREAAADGNEATEPQADWLPLFDSPPYPDHPSGYNCFAAAMMQAARNFFRTDTVTFDLTSSLTGTTRTYTRFSAVLVDTIEGRLCNGFHFRTPDVHGALLGQNVANWVTGNFFKRIR